MNFFQDFEEKAGLTNRIVAQANGRSLAADTLLRKLAKHQPREKAIYLASFLGWGKEPLPEEAKEIARRNNLKHTESEVGYPHQDGTYHWFPIK